MQCSRSSSVLRMGLRTAYLDVAQRDLRAQLEHAVRDRSTVLVYGRPTLAARMAAALLATERALGRSLTCTREHDRWVVHR